MPPTSPATVIWTIIGMIAICVAAYYATRLLAGRARVLARSKYLQVKDSLFIARDKSISVVEANGKYYLLGITNHSIQLLAELDGDELAEVAVEPGQMPMEQIKGAYGKVSGWVQRFTNAPKELENQRRRAAGARKPPQPEEEGQDFDEMLQRIQRRRERVENKTDRDDE